MSQFVCGISGETVEEPVVSQVSGTVYEKRLIHKWIQENGTDPGITRVIFHLLGGIKSHF